MKNDREIHHRRSIRLKGYDYSQPGAYFFTLVTAGRVRLFGEIIDGQMYLNETGEILLATWRDLPNHYPYVKLGAFVVMPNHIHGIVELTAVGAGLTPAPTETPHRHALSEIVRAFKSFSARRVNERSGTTGHPLWQRNYYEHVIRNRKEWERIHQYVESNPDRWEQDRENPTCRKKHSQEQA